MKTFGLKRSKDLRVFDSWANILTLRLGLIHSINMGFLYRAGFTRTIIHVCYIHVHVLDYLNFPSLPLALPIQFSARACMHTQSQRSVCCVYVHTTAHLHYSGIARVVTYLRSKMANAVRFWELSRDLSSNFEEKMITGFWINQNIFHATCR